MAATIRPHSAADEELKLETEAAQATGLVGPASWWRLGLIALLIVVAVLLALQLLGGNSGTDVIPGTPITAPQTNVPVPAAG
jgi:hypothetical protein